MSKNILSLFLLSTTIFAGCASSEYDPANYIDRAALYYGNKDYARSLNQAERAIELDPSSVTAWNIRGWSLYFLGHVSKTDRPDMNATECFRYVTREIDDDSWEAWYGLSSCFMKEIRDYEKEYSDVLGMKEMHRLFSRFRDAGSLFESDYMELDESLPRFKQFMEHLESKQLIFTEERHRSVVGDPARELLALESQGEDDIVYPYFWGAYIKQSNYDDFLNLYSRDDADIIANRVNRILVAFEDAKLDLHLEWMRKFIVDRANRMRRGLERVIQLNPDYVRAHQLRSAMLLLLLNLDFYKNSRDAKQVIAQEARTHLEAFSAAWLERVSDLSEQSEKLNAQYFTVGNQEYRTAILHQRDLVEDDLHDKKMELAEAYKNLAFICAMLDDNLSALGYLDNALTFKENDPMIFFQRGKVYRDLGETSKAIDDFRMVRDIVLSDHPLFTDASDEIDSLVKRGANLIRVESVRGSAEYSPAGSTAFAQLHQGDSFESGAGVRTSLNSQVQLLCFGFFNMNLDAGTEITIGKTDLSIDGEVYFEVDVTSGTATVRLNERTVAITSEHRRAVIVVDTIGLEWSSVRIDLGGDGTIDRDIANNQLSGREN